LDEKCKNCQLICKRLDPEDQPASYRFSTLTPALIINTVEECLKKYSAWHHLKIRRSEKSLGDQLVMLLDIEYMRDMDEPIVLIAQAKVAPDGQNILWFRYQVPDECCQKVSMLSFSTMMSEIVETLNQYEYLNTK
jgi:hypothetical protein